LSLNYKIFTIRSSVSFFSVGIDNPTIEVRFENLNIDAEAYVGDRGIPTFTNFFSNTVMVRLQY
jgi:hypothetical protein